MWLFCFFFTYFMFVFFFKQKTAYEMRISDWSSDVCSSDLFDRPFIAFPLPEFIKLFALFAFKRLHHRTGCCQTGEDNEISVRPAIGGCHIDCGVGHAIAHGARRTRSRRGGAGFRSEEGRVGQGGYRTCRSRGAPEQKKKK